MTFLSKEKIIFYEKTGCVGNAKQKKVLSYHQISFETRSILDTSWSVENLTPFFEGLSTKEMINPFAPQITNKELNISGFTKEELIKLMVKTPILIKRPLLVIADKKICGFDIVKINTALKINICESLTISSCPSESTQVCTSV